jgi:hypothetical protein
MNASIDDSSLWRRSDVNSTISIDEFTQMLIDKNVMLIISGVGATLLLISILISLIIYRRKRMEIDLESKKHKVVDLRVFHENPLYKDSGIY